MSWIFQDEAAPYSLELRRSLSAERPAVVPPLWKFEVANVLIMGERRGRISETPAARHLLLLSMLPIEIDDGSLDASGSNGSLLARKHPLTAYDASSLELAQRRGLPLPSFHGALRKAAERENVKRLSSRK